MKNDLLYQEACFTFFLLRSLSVCRYLKWKEEKMTFVGNSFSLLRFEGFFFFATRYTPFEITPHALY